MHKTQFKIQWAEKVIKLVAGCNFVIYEPV